MDFDRKRADLLCRRYLDATASEAETDALRRMLCDAPHDALSQQMRICATMLRGFGALHAERMPEQGPVRATDAAQDIPEKRTERKRYGLLRARPAYRLRIRLATAAGIAAACAAGILLTVRPTVYGYLDGRPITDPADAIVAASYFAPLEKLAESLEFADWLLTPETH